MAIASLVLGIVALVISFVPILGIFAGFPAVASLILGIVSLVINNKNTNNKIKNGNGSSIAGVILSSISLVIILFWIVVFGISSSLWLDNNYNNKVYKRYNKNINIHRLLEDKVKLDLKVKI